MDEPSLSVLRAVLRQHTCRCFLSLLSSMQMTDLAGSFLQFRNVTVSEISFPVSSGKFAVGKSTINPVLTMPK